MLSTSTFKKFLARLKNDSARPIFCLRVGNVNFFSGSLNRANLGSNFHSETAGTSIFNALIEPQGVAANFSQYDGRISSGNTTFKILNINGRAYEQLARIEYSYLFRQYAYLFMGFDDLHTDNWPMIFGGRVMGARISEPDIVELSCVNLQYTALEEEIMKNCDGTAGNQVKITGHPVNFLYRLLLDNWVLSGKGAPSGFPLDEIIGSPTGLGLGSSYIDGTQFQAERDLFYPNLKMQFIFREPINCRSFLEENFFKPLLAMYLTAATAAQVWRIAFHRPVQPPASPRELTDEDFIGQPRWARDFAKLINRVRVYGDYDPDGSPDQFTLLADEETNTEACSADFINDERILDIEMVGLRDSITYGSSSWSGGTIYAIALAQRILSKFGNYGVETMKGVLSRRHADLEPKDFVLISNKNLPHYENPLREKMEKRSYVVVGLVPDFKAGAVKADFVREHHYRPAVLHTETSPPTYANASEAQRLYCYIANSSGYMSDGTRGYTVV